MRVLSLISSSHQCLHLLSGLRVNENQQVASALHRSKDPLKKRLKEQAKIARWDEQTYYALAEAADRSHRHLFKMLRQYDQVLEEPVSSILVSAADGGAGGKSGGGADASLQVTSAKLVRDGDVLALEAFGRFPCLLLDNK